MIGKGRKKILLLGVTAGFSVPKSNQRGGGGGGGFSKASTAVMLVGCYTWLEQQQTVDK